MTTAAWRQPPPARGFANGASSSITPSRRIKPHQVYPQWSSPPPQHAFWKPNEWLGAYYRLRDDDPAAVANRARLMGKRTPRRGSFIVSAMEDNERKRLEAAQPWREMHRWRPGTYLEVDHTPRVGDALERVVGILLGIKRKGLGSSFRLLCHTDGTSVEYQFQTFSPLVRSQLLPRRAHTHTRPVARPRPAVPRGLIGLDGQRSAPGHARPLDMRRGCEVG